MHLPKGIIAAGILLLLLAPAAARGQASPDPGDSPSTAASSAGPRLQATAFAGVLAPLARLTSDPQTFETEVSSSAMVGAEVSWWPRGRLGIAAQAAWAPARLSLIPTDFTGALPGDLGDADYLVGSLEARYRVPMPPEVRVVRPYLALGGGIRRLDVDPIASPEVTDATDPLATAAAGAQVRLGARVDLRVELRDRVSVYGSPTGGGDRVQNDLGVSIGLGIGRN